MKIVLIHLSDLHISSKEAINADAVDALINSLNVLPPFSGAIIAISGDVAMGGFAFEYVLATEFISSICSKLISTFEIETENLKVIIAPGNHDINRNVSKMCSRDKVAEWHKNSSIDKQVQSELDGMADYFEFAKRHDCYNSTEHSMFLRKVLPFKESNGNKCYIETIIINSSPFSSDDDKGVHYLPKAVLDKLVQLVEIPPTSMTIMHHSPNWFCLENEKQLQELIYSRSQLVLFGHEHYETTQEVEINSTKPTIIQSGGAWWKKGFENSSYYCGVIDTISNKYFQYEFVWDGNKQLYQHQNPKEYTLVPKSADSKHLTPTDEYIRNLLSDEKHRVCEDISNYFVFPHLKIEAFDDYTESTVIKTMDNLVEKIKNSAQMMILGQSGSGKTTLARMLLLRLAREFTVLLCGIDEVRGKSQKNIINSTFHDMYNSSDFTAFEQLNRRNRIIIIDDVNHIQQAHRTKLLQGLTQAFGHVILLGDEDRTFDLHARVCEELNLEQEINKVSIERFYADKRSDLVSRIVKLMNNGGSFSNEELERQIENVLVSQELSYKLSPDFIVQIASFYCTNVQELLVGNINVFSKVFEASIDMSIAPYLTNETVGQVKTALGDVAHFIHFEKSRKNRLLVSESDIENIISGYTEKYDESITAAKFISITTNAKVLIRENDELCYKFKNNDHLAYFVAESIIRKFNEHDSQAEANLLEITDFSCFSINPTILKFIAYTTGSMRIVELLLRQAQSHLASWPVYNLDEKQFTYLANLSESERIVAKGTKNEEIDAKAKHERSLTLLDSDEVEVVDIYDFDEADLDNIINQFKRATLQMVTLSSCLVTFGHIMKAPLKKELIKTVYGMPNQIFYKFASDIDENIDDWVNEFMEEEKITGQNLLEEKRKVHAAIRRISINVLLNLYYCVAVNLASPTTIVAISKDEYIENTNHELERLMFLEHADSCGEFIKKTDKLYGETKCGMVKNMITAMISHMLVWSPTLSKKKRNHLIDKYGFTDMRKSMLLDRAKINTKK